MSSNLVKYETTSKYLKFLLEIPLTNAISSPQTNTTNNENHKKEEGCQPPRKN